LQLVSQPSRHILGSTSISRTAVIGILSFVVLSGCKATPPNKLETTTVNWAKKHITIGGKSDKNPHPATPDSLDNGKAVFAQSCSICHGLDGQNTGVAISTKMSPQVPLLTAEHVQAYTDGQLHWIIKNGIYPSGMPAATDDFSDDDMWDMVNYIRHLPKAGALGDPPAYSK
jgi:mono/diheme cytochrome c family protein